MESVRFIEEDGVGRITLNTDDKNSFTFEVFQKLDAALKSAMNSNLGVLVIGSDREGVFSQGLNLGELKKEEIRKDLVPFLDYFFGILQKIYFFPCPVLAEISGHAIGYGAMIGIASDFRFGLQNARIGLPEVKIGIRVPASVAKMFSNIVGIRETERHILLGVAYKGSEANEIGLLDEVFDDSAVLKDAVQKFAKKLSKNSRSATSSCKEAVRYLSKDLREMFEYDKRKTIESIQSVDAVEGIEAMINGRRPEFNKAIS
ncbi:enoyl-CoA hydratase/isomerase family protein [Leptospira broomii serovar Hurstbridge str. 5399]|uniref:Enoyl-CoA hydratase/isomerase family protein n=1 Tax=Leptospira broomii serovar Hurstbridge str. 5399 TaxID=1049789 RepID=T0F6S9_9LEPT|nr:enoyl-CoA hydratase/isomerase family protein [Leptospira broomii]EQA46855.1 enoyl-CoA hydratase/isomerase family protein [Leptospira broomii serovar Hurstbridge str. 5399]